MKQDLQRSAREPLPYHGTGQTSWAPRDKPPLALPAAFAQTWLRHTDPFALPVLISCILPHDQLF